MSRATLYPGAVSQPESAGVEMSGIDIVLWHTTESAGWPSYPSFAPQLTVDPLKKQVRQHMPVNRAGSTLENAGSYRTNRANVLQVEIVGYVDPKKSGSPYYAGKWGDEEYKYLAEIAAWAYAEWGVPLSYNCTFVTYPASYGYNAKQRFSVAKFDTYKGHCGHQHAPGNSHGDPSNFDIERLLKFARENVNEPEDPEDPPTKPLPKPFAPGQILPGGSITTPFGKKGSWQAGYHTGDDWNVGDPGEDYWFPLYATKPGKVVYVGEDGWGEPYGRQVIVEYADKRRGNFCHLAQYSVKVGDTVRPGTQIGRVGYSGNVIPEGPDGSHCHYEERVAPYRYDVDSRKPVYLAATWTWDGKSFPGSERLQLGDEGPWVTLLGKRLKEWGYTGYAEGPGPVMGPKDLEGATWVRRKQGWTGNNIDEKLWDLLMTDPPEDEEPKPKKTEWSVKPTVTLKTKDMPSPVTYLQGVVRVAALRDNDGKLWNECYVMAQDINNEGDTRFVLFDDDGNYQSWMLVPNGGHGQTFHAYRSIAGNLWIWTLIGDVAYRIMWASGKSVTPKSEHVHKADYKGCRPVGTHEPFIGWRDADSTYETFYLHNRYDFVDGKTTPLKTVKVKKGTNLTQQSWTMDDKRIIRLYGKTNLDPGEGTKKHVIDVLNWKGELLLNDFDITDMTVDTTSDEPEGVTWDERGDLLAGKREGGSKPNRSYPIWTIKNIP
jgi:murein DD-endopeptidase MepM/ murein hydrolase activator NlpD